MNQASPPPRPRLLLSRAASRPSAPVLDATVVGASGSPVKCGPVDDPVQPIGSLLLPMGGTE